MQHLEGSAASWEGTAPVHWAPTICQRLNLDYLRILSPIPFSTTLKDRHDEPHFQTRQLERKVLCPTLQSQWTEELSLEADLSCLVLLLGNCHSRKGRARGMGYRLAECSNKTPWQNSHRKFRGDPAAGVGDTGQKVSQVGCNWNAHNRRTKENKNPFIFIEIFTMY